MLGVQTPIILNIEFIGMWKCMREYKSTKPRHVYFQKEKKIPSPVKNFVV